MAPDELLFSVTEIEIITAEFRQTDLVPATEFEKYIFCGASGTDGIYFAFRAAQARNAEEMYRWNPSERLFSE